MTNALVLGFSGKMGAGKTALSSAVSDLLGCRRVSFGDYVRSVAEQRGLITTREVLQELGASLVEQDGDAFCHAVLAQANWLCGMPLVVDGIRHLNIAKRLSAIVGPSFFRLIVIALPQADRIERLRARDPNDIAKQSIAESHSTERDVEELLPRHADLIVDGAQSLEQLSLQIVSWVRSLGGVKN